MNKKLLTYYTSIAICIVLFATSCEKTGGSSDESKPDNNATLNKWLTDVSFQKVNVTSASAGCKDIVFNKGNAAVLDTRNVVSFSYDNGTNWDPRLSLSGNTFQCIALQLPISCCLFPILFSTLDVLVISSSAASSLICYKSS